MNKKFSLLVKIFSLLVLSNDSLSQVSEIQMKRQINDLKNGPIIALTTAEKVGKGALFWVVNSNDDYIYANKIFLTCDGKTLSYSIDSVLSFEEDQTKRLAEVYSKINLITPNERTDAIEFVDFDDSELNYKNFARRNIKEICSKLKAEKRGEQIPIAESDWQKDNTKTVTAFLPGTFSRNGSVVDGWFRSYDVLRKEHKKSDGSIYYLQNGNPLYFNHIKDKSYTMIKWVFDCKTNKSSINQMLKYDNSGSVLNSKSFAADFNEVVPNSVGEKILNGVCKIY